MKIKKATRKLDKAAELVESVFTGFEAPVRETTELIRSAHESIQSAKAKLEKSQPPKKVTKRQSSGTIKTKASAA